MLRPVRRIVTGHDDDGRSVDAKPACVVVLGGQNLVFVLLHRRVRVRAWIRLG